MDKRLRIPELVFDTGAGIFSMKVPMIFCENLSLLVNEADGLQLCHHSKDELLRIFELMISLNESIELRLSGMEAYRKRKIIWSITGMFILSTLIVFEDLLIPNVSLLHWTFKISVTFLFGCCLYAAFVNCAGVYAGNDVLNLQYNLDILRIQKDIKEKFCCQ
ncbi:hypothetical protein MTO98_26055 [Mucilaginibacter sp. SMC90]|nr:hypothetical protein [Mucilaginibacter sp. SMC90]UOE47878.1 hypothetical protein MTO98_26055 [Mucilaginibacter sp. SMC90]